MALNRTTAVIAIFLAAIFSLAGTSVADERTDAIAERITPVGNVCMAGEPCPTASAAMAAAPAAAAAAPAASQGPMEPEAVFNTFCNACHSGAIPTSPKFGDAAAWEPRIAKGIDALYTSALNGTATGMPARGTCNACSDDDIKATVDYMVEHAK